MALLFRSPAQPGSNPSSSSIFEARSLSPTQPLSCCVCRKGRGRRKTCVEQLAHSHLSTVLPQTPVPSWLPPRLTSPVPWLPLLFTESPLFLEFLLLFLESGWLHLFFYIPLSKFQRTLWSLMNLFSQPPQKQVCSVLQIKEPITDTQGIQPTGLSHMEGRPCSNLALAFDLLCGLCFLIQW